jgi:hypothetical protein
MSAIRFLEMTLVVRDKEQRLMMSLRASTEAKHSKSMWESRRVSSTTLHVSEPGSKADRFCREVGDIETSAYLIAGSARIALTLFTVSLLSAKTESLVIVANVERQ